MLKINKKRHLSYGIWATRKIIIIIIIIIITKSVECGGQIVHKRNKPDFK